MKIVATVAEYNPFHNGHLKHVNFIKQNIGCDKLLVIMSGDFTQRGENAVMDKFTRAKHAIMAGADMVIELPTIFATANAEIFATGAVKILNDLNCVDELCFGVESGEVDDYYKSAKALLTETKELKSLIKEELETGVSPVKARFNAIKKLNSPELKDELVSSPNNILGLEYTKAILKLDSKIAINPMIRTGDHNDETFKKGITSASSIRKELSVKKSGKLKKVMPTYVYNDLPKTPYNFDDVIMAKLFTESAEDIGKILDCTEGLENRIKALIKDNVEYKQALDKITTKRYTYARVRRITIANLLGIKEKLIFKALDSKLYAKILAVKESSKDMISYLNENSSVPILTRKKDYAEIKKTAKDVLDIDNLANDVYNLVSKTKQNEYQMITVK